MNFIDYCIATKNYSALNAVNEYTKSFAYGKYLNGHDLDDRHARRKIARMNKAMLPPSQPLPYLIDSGGNLVPMYPNKTPKDKEQSKDNLNDVRK